MFYTCEESQTTSKISVLDHIFSLYFVILVISGFGFEGLRWVLIASVPDLCIFLLLTYHLSVVWLPTYLLSIFLQKEVAENVIIRRWRRRVS